MSRYPDILVNGTNPLLELMQYTNTVTNDTFGSGILIAIFVIFFISTRRFGHAGTLSSLFSTTMIGWVMRVLGLVPEFIVLFFTVGLIGMTLYYFLKGM